MPVRQKQRGDGVGGASVNPAWFPMTLLAMHMMGTNKLMKTAKKRKTTGTRRCSSPAVVAPADHDRHIDDLDESASFASGPTHTIDGAVIGSDLPSAPSRPTRSDEIEDPIEVVNMFWEACHRKLTDFVAFAEIPRPGQG